MKKVVALIFFSLIFCVSYSQTVTIGILTDKKSEETSPLLDQLKSEIIAVVGQEADVIFKDVLENNFNGEIAEQNYQALINSDTDIILSFGLTNTIVLYQKKTYNKPTIVFGSINKDFIYIP